MIKIFIKNRFGKNISVTVEENPNAKGLAFIMHGLGGFKEQPHIQTFAQAFRDNGFTVVLFDTTHAFGESEGKYEDATNTNYYEDLEDVINWSQTQKWYKEPFILVGHSDGGKCVTMYAENFPDTVKAVAPISTSINGALNIEAEKNYRPDDYKKWEKTGIQEYPSKSKPGIMKRLNWYQYRDDTFKYDILKLSDKLTMPALFIVGDGDRGTPVEHQKILFDKLPGKKEMHIIKDAPHTFTSSEHLREIKGIFDKWIKDNLC